MQSVKLWSSSLCSVIQYSVTSSLPSPNHQPHSTLFLKHCWHNINNVNCCSHNGEGWCLHAVHSRKAATRTVQYLHQNRSPPRLICACLLHLPERKRKYHVIKFHSKLKLIIWTHYEVSKHYKSKNSTYINQRRNAVWITSSNISSI
jgi:hypothetical protein